METACVLSKNAYLKPTAFLCRVKLDDMEQYIRFIEPKERVRLPDLIAMASYMIKVGTNIKLAQTLHSKGIEPDGYSLTELNTLIKLLNKYDLTWDPNCEKSDLDLQSNKSLYHVAVSFPKIFLDVAARITPGTYDEKRFWWCAGNIDFWTKKSPFNLSRKQQTRRRRAPNRLLSDILHILLTPDDCKLITVRALSATVKHGASKMSMDGFRENLMWVQAKVCENALGKRNPELKQHLRERYNIAEAEAGLKPIDPNLFAEWWNITGLRK